VLDLRLAGQTDEAFLVRAERAAVIARVLIEACLANQCMQRLIADPGLPMFTEESAKTCPTVRVEFEQAIAFGGIGETLDATKSKHWGDGPYILPLEPDDEFFSDRITYQFRANSLYNRRFHQRKRLKELLGRVNRKLVGEAKYHTKGIFLRDLTNRQAEAIRRTIGVEPGLFWRACKGRSFLELPTRAVQTTLPFGEDDDSVSP
jgi:hypothetical protein